MFYNIEYHLLILRCLHLLDWVNHPPNCATAHYQLRFIAGSINVMIYKGVKSCLTLFKTKVFLILFRGCSELLW